MFVFLFLLLSLIFPSTNGTRWTHFVTLGNYPKTKSSLIDPTRTRLFMGLNDLSLELCDENADLVIEEIKNELGTIFGYDMGSRNVGITGEIELVEVDGPTIVIALKGRFWHATDTVMMRVESYIKNRIPEVIEVKLDMEKSQIQDDNRLNTDGGRKLF